MTLDPDILTQLKSLVAAARVYPDALLAHHTYFKIGGPADVLVQTDTRQELVSVYRLALTHRLPVFFLGSGSNLVVSDQGIRGIVIKNRADRIRLSHFVGGIKTQKLHLEQAVVEADSGVITNHLVRYTIDAGLGGLQHFLGVPGTVGGAIYNNSHYKDQLIGNFIASVDVIDSRGQLKTYSQEEMEFGYDSSRLHRTRELVLSAKFVLSGGDKQLLWDQATGFAKARAASQPLSQPSSGCIFKNLSPQQLASLAPAPPTPSAGYLIDQAGLKGTRVGDIAVSDKHANFFVNLGHGTAADVAALMSLVQEKIRAAYGVNLEPEVFFVGTNHQLNPEQ